MENYTAIMVGIAADVVGFFTPTAVTVGLCSGSTTLWIGHRISDSFGVLSDAFR
jgi:hypothetical protein